MSVQISVEKEDHGVILVRITHNGSQWSTLRLYSTLELQALRDEIDDYLSWEDAKGDAV